MKHRRAAARMAARPAWRYSSLTLGMLVTLSKKNRSFGLRLAGATGKNGIKRRIIGFRSPRPAADSPQGRGPHAAQGKASHSEHLRCGRKQTAGHGHRHGAGEGIPAVASVESAYLLVPDRPVGSGYRSALWPDARSAVPASGQGTGDGAGRYEGQGDRLTAATRPRRACLSCGWWRSAGRADAGHCRYVAGSEDLPAVQGEQQREGGPYEHERDDKQPDNRDKARVRGAGVGQGYRRAREQYRVLGHAP